MILRLALAILLSGVCGTEAQAATAYVGASVLSESGDEFVPNVTLIVRGATIATVGPSGSVPLPRGSRIIHLEGRYIIPGLINSHVHIATVADARAAKAYLRRELNSGVTTVRDMAGDVRLIAEIARKAAKDEIASPDIYYAALFAGKSFFADPRTHAASRGLEPGQAPWMRAITPATNLKHAVAEAKATGATGIKLYADLSAAQVSAITAEAHQQRMIVWSHAAVFPARPLDVVRAGVDVMSHADFIGFESVTPFPQTFAQAKQTDLSHWQPTPAVESVLSEMKSRGVILDATVEVGFRDPVPNWPGSVAVRLAREAYRRGIPISAGTDDDFDPKDPRSALDGEIERLVSDVGMTNADALRSATIVGARTVGQQETSGVIAAGHAANFVVLDEDPLQDIHNLRTVQRVVKHGIPYRLGSDLPPPVATRRPSRG